MTYLQESGHGSKSESVIHNMAEKISEDENDTEVDRLSAEDSYKGKIWKINLGQEGLHGITEKRNERCVVIRSQKTSLNKNIT